MTLHVILRVSFVTLAALGALTSAGPPQWGWLGGEDDVAELCSESTNVVLVCIVDTELVYEVGARKLKPPFAKVLHHATVVQSHKGALKIGDRIEIGYAIRSQSILLSIAPCPWGLAPVARSR